MPVIHPADALRRRLPQPLLLAILAASLAVSCQGAADVPPSTRTLTIGTSIPKAPERGGGLDFIVNTLTLEAPVTIDTDGRPVGKLFDTWSALPDDLGVRFHLPQGIAFHDGTVLTNVVAADVLRNSLVVHHDSLSPSVVAVEPVGKRKKE